MNIVLASYSPLSYVSFEPNFFFKKSVSVRKPQTSHRKRHGWMYAQKHVSELKSLMSLPPPATPQDLSANFLRKKELHLDIYGKWYYTENQGRNTNLSIREGAQFDKFNNAIRYGGLAKTFKVLNNVMSLKPYTDSCVQGVCCEFILEEITRDFWKVIYTSIVTNALKCTKDINLHKLENITSWICSGLQTGSDIAIRKSWACL